MLVSLDVSQKAGNTEHVRYTLAMMWNIFAKMCKKRKCQTKTQIQSSYGFCSDFYLLSKGVSIVTELNIKHSHSHITFKNTKTN